MIGVYLILRDDLRRRSGLVDPQTRTETPFDVLFHTTLNAAVRTTTGLKKHRVLIIVLECCGWHVRERRGLCVFFIGV